MYEQTLQLVMHTNYYNDISELVKVRKQQYHDSCFHWASTSNNNNNKNKDNM